MKKWITKLTATAAAVLILFGCAVCARAAGSYFLSEGYYYGVQNNEAYVHGYASEDGDIVIREKFLSYYVTAVEDFAFYGNENVASLYLYDAARLATIGQCAFSRCVNLGYVEIPSVVRQMGASAFDGCTALREVRFRAGSVPSIPDQGFYGCTSLETVEFENDVTDIGAFAFANCAALKTITLPDTVTAIADNAFSGCDDLVIRCSYASYAMRYAKAQGIAYVLTDAGSFLIGDADGDGKVTILDATAIQRRLAALNVASFSEKGADVDGDGVNIMDATRIQRYLAGFSDRYHIGEPVA